MASNPSESAEHVTPLPVPEVTGFQRFTDALISRTILWAIPRSVRPNAVTIARFVLLVPLIYLLLTDRKGPALVVFVVAASTDFIDGAMARTRGQITNVGIVIDPLADKLLIGTTLALLGWQYLIIKIIVIALAIELVGVLLGTLLWLRGPHRGRLPGANVFGKVKMTLQSLGGGLFLLGGFLDLEGLVRVSLILLWAALAFAVLSLLRVLQVGTRGYARGV